MLARIAIISEHASPLATLGGVDSGGQNVYVAQLANHLAARGYRVDIFTRRDDRDLPETVKFISRVRVVHVAAGPPRPVPKEQLLPHMDEFARNMLAFCSRQGFRYDLVHANFWTSGVAALQVTEALRIPLVMTFHALGRVRRLHQSDADRFPDERPLIEEEIIARANRVIAECPQDREDLMELYGADPRRISVIPCGFDPGELWPVGMAEARRQLCIDPNEFLILQLGRMVPRKGIDTAIQALARMRHDYGIDASLMVVGGESEHPDPSVTPEIGRLRDLARDRRVADRVLFVGRRSRQVLRYYYGAADVFVTTPWYEPFGITPVEAMACGTPVVGARVGGIKTTVRHGRTGFLVPPRDAEALAERLAYLHSNPGLRQTLGRAARVRAARCFTWAQVADRVEAVYRQLAVEREEPVPAVRVHGDQISCEG